MSKNTSMYFLLPVAGIDVRKNNPALDKAVNTYLKSSSSELGSKFFVEYSISDDELVRTELTTKDNFANRHVSNNDTVIYEFNVTENLVPVVNRIAKGEYSLVSKDYVEAHYPAHSYLTHTNRKIFERDKEYKNYWERRIGVELPEGAEVWSKPDIEKETINL